MFVIQAISLSFTGLPSDFALALTFSYIRPEAATTWPNKQLWHKIQLFFIPICHKEINKVILVLAYELENTWHLLKNRLKITNFPNLQITAT